MIKDRLIDVLKKYRPLAVAFSGGTDSTLLAKAAYEALGDDVTLFHVLSPLIPERESQFAERWAKENNIKFHKIYVDVLQSPLVKGNPPERCYYCKLIIMEAIRSEALKSGINFIADGTNIDDLNDYRPGLKAAEEKGIKHPYVEADINKDKIRELAKEYALPNWDKPASGCLATRIASGTSLEGDILKKVDKAELFLEGAGFKGSRARILSEKSVKIEVLPCYFKEVIEKREEIVKYFSTLNFSDVFLDLKGYRKGAMNSES